MKTQALSLLGTTRLLSRSDGSFQAKADFATGARPFAVAIADVDRNGKPDWLVANSAGGSASVVLNKTSFAPIGKFSAAAYVLDYGYPGVIAAGNINNDGKPDLILIDIPGGEINTFLGQGNGSFSYRKDTGYSGSFGMTEQGDLNNDGKPDLVTVSEIPTYGQLGVSLGNGDGTFAAPTRYSAGAMPRNLQIGDLNRDGKADVLVTDDFREYVHIFLGNGSGSLTAQPDFLINATGSTATHATGVNLLALGDLNNDGKLDAAISIETQDSSKTTHYFIRLLLGNGDGTLTAKAGDISAREPAYQGTLKLAQLNADAHLDMLQGNADGTVSVWLGQGNGNFTANGTYTASSSDTLISVADINADNRADLVATNYAGSAISVFLGTGNGSFLGKIDYSIDSHPTGVEISDFNRDGKPDLAAITFFGAIAIFSNGMP